MNTATGVVIFAAGAAIGSFVSWHIFRKQHEQLIQEMDDMIRNYEERIELDKEALDKAMGNIGYKTESEENPAGKNPENKVDPVAEGLRKVGEAANKLHESIVRPLTATEDSLEVPELDDEYERDPYIITEEQFDEYQPEGTEHDDFDKIALSYFADRFLVNELGDLVDDVAAVVGFEALNKFDDRKVNTVFVRNERLQTDFEIVRDLRNYADVDQPNTSP